MRKIPFALLIFLSLITSCNSSSKLNGTWKIIDDSYDNVNYQFIIFERDSIKIRTIGMPVISFARSEAKNTLDLDSLIRWKYSFSDDTLLLNRGYSRELKLLRHLPKPIESDFLSVRKKLTEYTWTYSYGSCAFESTLNLDAWWPNIYKGQTHAFINNNYENTFEKCAWAIEDVDGTTVLVIVDIYDRHYYLNTFFLESVSEDSIVFKAWNYSKEFEIKFVRSQKIPLDHLQNIYDKLTSQSWKLEDYSIFEEPTGLIDLGTLVNVGTVLPNSMIKEEDLKSHSLTYQFKQDSTFSLLNRQTVVCKGKWRLFPNGNIVELKSDLTFESNYQIILKNIRILESENDELVIEQWLPLYENDSIIPDEYVTMILRGSSK